MNESIQQLASAIVSSGIARPGELTGCTPEEIASLERKFGIKLPELYRDWLRTMGRSAGHYLQGSDAFYPALLELRDWATELLAENGNPFSLADDAFVFLMHQGYQFLYFRTGSQNPDPPVMYYFEGKPQSQAWPNISGYFQQVLEDHRKALKL